MEDTIAIPKTNREKTAVSTSETKTPTQPFRPHWTRWHGLSLLACLIGIFLVGRRIVPGSPASAWMITLLLMAVFTGIAGNGILGRVHSVLIDERNLISLSRLQLLLWTLLILSAYITAALANIAYNIVDPLNIAIPSELWWLMGISTTSLVGSPLISNIKRKIMLTKTEEESAAKVIERIAQQRSSGIQHSVVVRQGKLIGYTDARYAHLSDMFRGETIDTGVHLDLAKVQMFFFTFILVLAYGAALGAMFLAASRGGITAFPAITDSTVALLGISHAGFLVSSAT